MSSSDYILIVDDEPDARRILAKIMQGLGHQTRSAGTGEEALQLVNQQTPSLILLDLMMPGMDGFQVLFQLRNNPRTRQIPVIVVTAISQEETEGLTNVAIMPKGNLRSNVMSDMLGTLMATPIDSNNEAQFSSDALTTAEWEAARSRALDLLSDREMEVLRLLSFGYSDKRMARELHVTVNTVKTHNKNIYDKLAVSNRTQAVALASELNLLN